MKRAYYHIILILLVLAASCSKENECDNPVDCLPPVTQTGANTAGCLVNGNLFLPGGQSLNSGSVLKAQYRKENGSQLFGLVINDLRSNSKTVAIEIRSEIIEINNTYVLSAVSDHGNFGTYLDEETGGFQTSENYTGKVSITNLDETKKFVSGTFEFTAVNKDDQIVEIQNGRFDVNYY